MYYDSFIYGHFANLFYKFNSNQFLIISILYIFFLFYFHYSNNKFHSFFFLYQYQYHFNCLSRNPRTKILLNLLSLSDLFPNPRKIFQVILFLSHKIENIHREAEKWKINEKRASKKKNRKEKVGSVFYELFLPAAKWKLIILLRPARA